MKPMQRTPPDFLHAEGFLPGSPVVLFIHGLGMNRSMWAEPEAARFMGGMFPMRVMLVGFEGRATVYQAIAARGYSVATWSQRRPVGPARATLAELGLALHELHRLGHREVVLVGHSRGGIVARAAMALPELFPPGMRLRGVVTISTPHGGTHLARWAGRIARVTNPLNNQA
jgi:pimeloyl-ACP methyl ester carboxylesterase